MKEIEERIDHVQKVLKGLSEQTSGNVTVLSANCQMLANRIETLEDKMQELEEINTPADDKLELLRNQIDKLNAKVQELEVKKASDLSQTVVSESETSHKKPPLGNPPEWITYEKLAEEFKHRAETILEEWNKNRKVEEIETSEQRLFLADILEDFEKEENLEWLADYNNFGDVFCAFYLKHTGIAKDGDQVLLDLIWNPNSENSEKPNNQDKLKACSLCDFTCLRQAVFDDHLCEDYPRRQNNRDNYPDHWPRKSDGSKLIVGDKIQFKYGDPVKITDVDYFHEKIKTDENDSDWFYFSGAHWHDGFRFTIVEEKVAKTFERERALKLLEDIQSVTASWKLNTEKQWCPFYMKLSELRELIIGGK